MNRNQVVFLILGGSVLYGLLATVSYNDSKSKPESEVECNTFKVNSESMVYLRRCVDYKENKVCYSNTINGSLFCLKR